MKPIWNQNNNCRKSGWLLGIALILIFGIAPNTVNAQEHDAKKSASHADHIMVKPENIKWMDGPPSIPAGAKFAVIEGDPNTSQYVRFKS